LKVYITTGARAIETRLILIDGIAGSGKSTTGQRLYRVLHLNGYSTEFYHEFCRPHPVLGVEADSVSDWIEQSATAWRQFIRQLSGQDTVAIFDGALFQCGVGELIERDADDETVADYVRAIAELVTSVRSAVIHLYQKDLETALRRICDRRPAAWRRRVFTLFSDTAYGRRRSLDGFDLYLDFNRSLRRLSDSLFETLDMPKLAIENADLQWDAHFERICRFLGLRQVIDPFNPHEYTGDYIEKGKNRHCRIHVSEGMLMVEGLFRIAKGLLPGHDDALFVQTWPDELTFTRDDSGRVVSFCSTGPWNRLGDAVWTRIGPTD
jgi:hypothetical protein